MIGVRNSSIRVFVAAALCLAPRVTAGIIDPCLSTVAVSPPNTQHNLIGCPSGDTESFLEQGFSITITLLDVVYGEPIPGIYATDVWLIGDDGIVLCGGSASSSADGFSDENGVMKMSLGTIAAGGCGQSILVVVQGWVIQHPLECPGASALPITFRSPDLNGDLEVNLSDLAIFAAAYPPQAQDPCADIDGNGIVNLKDLARFAKHYGHGCQ